MPIQATIRHFQRETDMENIVVQKMESEDEINGKGYVHYKSWHETYPGLVDPGYLARHTLEKCVAIAHKWPDNILIAKDGEKVIGFVGYGPYRDDTLPACGEVFALYVLSEYHGQRVGYELMRAAIEKLSTYRKVALWVLQGNERAIRFYERFGFQRDGAEAEIKLGTSNTEPSRRPGHYCPGPASDPDVRNSRIRLLGQSFIVRRLLFSSIALPWLSPSRGDHVSYPRLTARCPLCSGLYGNPSSLLWGNPISARRPRPPVPFA